MVVISYFVKADTNASSLLVSPFCCIAYFIIWLYFPLHDIIYFLIYFFLNYMLCLLEVWFLGSILIANIYIFYVLLLGQNNKKFC